MLDWCGLWVLHWHLVRGMSRDSSDCRVIICFEGRCDTMNAHCIDKDQQLGFCGY